MGASIEGLATARAGFWQRRPSSVGLSVRAARRALRLARCTAQEVDLIVNVGVYRDDNVAEPAIASFIQRRIGANPDALATSPRRTFSFDLANGTNGFLTALYVAAGYLRGGRVARALIVASDVDPTPRFSSGCPFEPSAAALVLRQGAQGSGFEGFGFESFGKDSHLFEGRVQWTGGDASGWLTRRRGRHALRIEEDDRFVARCADHAAGAVERFLATHGLEAPGLVVPSWAPAGFPAALATRMRCDHRLLLPERPERPYSAGPGRALEAGLARARAAGARSLLLVAAGAGITVGLALYRLEDDTRPAP